MHSHRRLLRPVALVILATLAAACGSTRDVVLHIRGADDLHPNSAGVPTPLKLWIMQVSAPGAFEAAPFLELSVDPEEALGEGCTDVRLETFVSGMETARPVAVHVEDVSKVSHIGLVGRYRKEVGGRWRLLLPLAEIGDEVGIVLRGYRIEKRGESAEEEAGGSG